MTFMSEPGSPADKPVIDLVSEGRAALEGMEPAPWLGGFTSWVNISEADAEGIVWLRNHAGILLDRLEAAEGALRESKRNVALVVSPERTRRDPGTLSTCRDDGRCTIRLEWHGGVETTPGR